MLVEVAKGLGTPVSSRAKKEKDYCVGGLIIKAAIMLYRQKVVKVVESSEKNGLCVKFPKHCILKAVLESLQVENGSDIAAMIIAHNDAKRYDEAWKVCEEKLKGL